MSLPVVVGESKLAIYSGMIGSILAIIISLIFLIHLTIMYHRIFTIQKSQQHKTSYLLVIIWFIISITQCIAILCTRSNTLTQIPTSQFTSLQCLFGFFLHWVSWILGYALLMVIFIRRIDLVFKGTPYQYKPSIIKTLYICVVALIVLFISYLVLRVNVVTNWTLLYYKQTNLVYCLLVAPDLDRIQLSFGAIYVISKLIGDMIILYMFIKRLWSLRRELISQFVLDHVSKNLGLDRDKNHKQHKLDIPKTPDTPDTNSEDTIPSNHSNNHSNNPSNDAIATPSTPGMDTSIELAAKRLTIGVVWKKYESSKNTELEKIVMSDKIGRIVKLHDTMKKQTILACVAFVSSFIYGVFLSFASNETSMQSGYDSFVNAVCVWLTLGANKEYFVFCSKYGFCKCCYDPREVQRTEERE